LIKLSVQYFVVFYQAIFIGCFGPFRMPEIDGAMACLGLTLWLIELNGDSFWGIFTKLILLRSYSVLIGYVPKLPTFLLKISYCL
jgi:hypothetical protein